MSNLVPKQNCLLLLIFCWSACLQFTVLSQPCVPHSEPGSLANSYMEWGQGPVQTLCNKRSKRNIKLSFVFCWYINVLLLAYFNLCFWFWLSWWSLLTFFWTQLLILHLLQNVFLCLWQRRMFGVSKTRDRVGWRHVHESSVGSPESEWQRERVTEMLSICQRKQFSWFGCQSS